MEPDNKLLIFLLALISPFKFEASSGLRAWRGGGQKPRAGLEPSAQPA